MPKQGFPKGVYETRVPEEKMERNKKDSLQRGQNILNPNPPHLTEPNVICEQY